MPNVRVWQVRAAVRHGADDVTGRIDWWLVGETADAVRTQAADRIEKYGHHVDIDVQPIPPPG